MICNCDIYRVAVIILVLYSMVNIVFLVGNILVLSEDDQSVENFVSYLESESHQLRDDVLVNTVREILVKNTQEQFALPITVTMILLCSNLLAVWGLLFSLHLLIWPWLLVYFIYIIFLVSLLVYFMIILSNVWLQVIIFLIMAPLLLIVFTSWLLVARCYTRLQRKSSSPFRVPTQLMTLYAPEPPVWRVQGVPGRSLSDKFGLCEREKQAGRSNVHTSRLEIEVGDGEKQGPGCDRAERGKERRRITSGTLSEKYSYDEQELTVEFPTAN